MVPVKLTDPIAAIGVYWATKRRSSHLHMKMLKSLAEAVAEVLDKINK
jgi:hypothetical protein